VPRGAKSRMRRTETPKPIWMKFGLMVDIPDTVTYTNFGDHRLRGFWVAGVKFPPLPLTFIVALTTRSHKGWKQFTGYSATDDQLWTI